MSTFDLTTRLANTVRGLAIDAVEAANSGHPGAPLGMADIATVLCRNHLKYDAADPQWPDRDRLVFSNGHASALLYALLYLIGVKDLALEDLKNFRQWDSKTPGHPELRHTPGVEATTGPLGQGFAMAVGMAIAERRLREEFGAALCDHRIWVFLGDGCLMEGIAQEAASLAGHLKLGKLIVLYDSNNISIDGATSLAFSENTPEKFRALGWEVLEADGHDFSAIDDAFSKAQTQTDAPTLIQFTTTIGKGASIREGSSAIHGSPLGDKESAATKAKLGLDPSPFSVPQDLLTEWRKAGKRSAPLRKAWQERLEKAAPNLREALKRRLSGALPNSFESAIANARSKFFEAPTPIATRKASLTVLEALVETLPELIGGSADLTGSNLTRPASMTSAFTQEASARYVHYGVREFAMAAAMNGLATHGGFIPYGGTFLVFSDYARNAIRLSALMGLRVVYVMTHDSIGLGEDGPTHQPIEHLASLRAMPNLFVFRPADLIETLECWEIALRAETTPSLLALSRHNLPPLREKSDANLTACGAYAIKTFGAKRDVTILATGSEVHIAVKAAETLFQQGVNATVVSMPCWEIFEKQPEAYRKDVLGEKPRVAIEAASRFGWTRYVASEDHVLGIDSFGASAPADILYEKFGLTSEALVKKVNTLLNI